MRARPRRGIMRRRARLYALSLFLMLVGSITLALLLGVGLLRGLDHASPATFGLAGSARRRSERPMGRNRAREGTRAQRGRCIELRTLNLICLPPSCDNTSRPITRLPRADGKIMSNAFFDDPVASVAERGRSMLKIKPWPKDADKRRRATGRRLSGFGRRAGPGVGRSRSPPR